MQLKSQLTENTVRKERKAKCKQTNTTSREYFAYKLERATFAKNIPLMQSTWSVRD